MLLRYTPNSFACNLAHLLPSNQCRLLRTITLAFRIPLICSPLPTPSSAHLPLMILPLSLLTTYDLRLFAYLLITRSARSPLMTEELLNHHCIQVVTSVRISTRTCHAHQSPASAFDLKTSLSLPTFRPCSARSCIPIPSDKA